MKLGTETNSLVNHLYSRQVIGQPEPTIGMGATLLSWTDRHAATVTGVNVDARNNVVITVRQDIVRRVDGNGMSEDQRYEYTTDEQGAMSVFRRERDGKWTHVRWSEGAHRYVKAGGYGLLLGRRDEYHDFSF